MPSGPTAKNEKLGLTLNPELLPDVILISETAASKLRPGMVRVMGSTVIGPTSKVGSMPRWIEGMAMFGMLIGPMWPIAAKPNGMDGMWMGGMMVAGPMSPVTSAPTAGNSGMGYPKEKPAKPS
ncbi:Uncharacterised protein [Mycobacterium tuberculosis]|nr:Uncharacterised protein [Mycobacterium tuberculosis]